MPPTCRIRRLSKCIHRWKSSLSPTSETQEDTGEPPRKGRALDRSSPTANFGQSVNLDHVADDQPARVPSTPTRSPFTQFAVSTPPADTSVSLVTKELDESRLERLQECLQERIAGMPAGCSTPKTLQAVIDLLEVAEETLGRTKADLARQKLKIVNMLAMLQMRRPITPTAQPVTSCLRPGKRKLNSTCDVSSSRIQKRTRKSILPLKRTPEAGSASVDEETRQDEVKCTSSPSAGRKPTLTRRGRAQHAEWEFFE